VAQYSNFQSASTSIKQPTHGQRLEEVLVEKGLLSQKGINVALDEQKWLNFLV